MTGWYWYMIRIAAVFALVILIGLGFWVVESVKIEQQKSAKDQQYREWSSWRFNTNIEGNVFARLRLELITGLSRIVEYKMKTKMDDSTRRALTEVLDPAIVAAARSSTTNANSVKEALETSRTLYEFIQRSLADHEELLADAKNTLQYAEGLDISYTELETLRIQEPRYYLH